MTIKGPLSTLGRRFKSLTGCSDSELEAFQLHLRNLDLLGHQFTLRQYTDALSAYWDIKIAVLNYPDQQEPILQSHSLAEGSLGCTRARISAADPIIIEIRESLIYRPWPAYELIAYHELMHHVCEHEDDNTISIEQHQLQEEQATRWANWALLASSEPELFSREGAETIT